MKEILKIINITLIFLLIACNSEKTMKIKKDIQNSYLSKNQKISNQLQGKVLKFYEITGCENVNDLKAVLIYRELDCLTCIQNCYEYLESKAYFKNLAIIKIGVVNKKDSLIFKKHEEIYSDEGENILNNYDYFPTPVVFDLNNYKIKECHFCY